MTDPGECAHCGTNPAHGWAQINDDWYCHEGTSPTCYELAIDRRSRPGVAVLKVLTDKGNP